MGLIGKENAKRGHCQNKRQFSPVSFWEMISLVSFIFSSVVMAIDLAMSRGNWLRNSSIVREEGFPLDLHRDHFLQ